MSAVAETRVRNPQRTLKSSREWQDAQWRKWPTPAHWPESLDVYEAAAYKRISPSSIIRASEPGRDGKAKLGHQRFGGIRRYSKATLDAFGVVPQREEQK